MKKLGRALFLVTLVLWTAVPVQAADYSGLWLFELKVKKSSCAMVSVGDPLEFSMEVEQQGRVLRANPLVVGVGEFYTGHTHVGGYTMTLESSCVVAPEGACRPRVESWLFNRPLKGKKKAGTIVWLSVERAADNSFVCATVYTGKARPVAHALKKEG